jgi:indole-3-glycerol phosphate synthase
VAILDDIVDRQRRALAANPPDEARLRETAEDAAAPRDFVGAIKDGPHPALIAECKRRSPVRGLLDADYDIADRVRAYISAGASAVSVLTNADFDGELAHLDAARAAVDAPLLRKDFIIDPLQLLEARAHGADAVLLIARILEPASLAELASRARDIGLQTLIEIHDESELDAAVSARPDMLGVNQRELATFEVIDGLFAVVARSLPEGIPMVAESGLKSREDVAAASAAGARAVLVGEALMTADDPAAKVRELLGAGVATR